MDLASIADSVTAGYIFTDVFMTGGGENENEQMKPMVAGYPVENLLSSAAKKQTGGGEEEHPQFAGLAIPAGLVLDSREQEKQYNTTHAEYDGGSGNYSAIRDDIFDKLYDSIIKEKKRNNGTRKNRTLSPKKR